MEHPPDWFWNILESTRPSLMKLESWLVTAPREHVEEFAAAYELAAKTLCDYWDGPLVDGIQYSEDDTEDLCNWIVSQGRELWHKVAGGDLDIGHVASVVARRDYNLLPVAIKDWSTEVRDPKHRGYQAPESIAMGVYYSRFGKVWSGD